MAMLTFDNVYKKYGKKKVLSGFSLKCANEILFLAGKNGAGKTTLIRGALGLERFDKGTVLYKNESEKYGSSKRKGVVFDTPCLYGQMSCQQNIKIFCCGFEKDSCHVNSILESLQIDKDLLRKKVSACSFGQQHRLSVAIALIRKPVFLFLDEPSVGLDPFSWKLVREAIVNNNNEQGGCTIITGQDYLEMSEMSDRIAVLDKGTVQYLGKTQELLASLPGKYYMNVSGKILNEKSLLLRDEKQEEDGSYSYLLPEKMPVETAFSLASSQGLSVLSISEKPKRLEDAIRKLLERRDGCQPQ